MSDRHSGKGQCSRLKISETILKTGQMEVMKDWYRKVLEVEPFFEHAPSPGSGAGDFGGQTRATDLHMCFFRLSEEYPWTQVIGIFEEPGVSGTVPKSTPGLHHMQLMMDDVATLIGKYEEMSKLGFRPHRSANHGPMTSFYYRFLAKLASEHVQVPIELRLAIIGAAAIGLLGFGWRLRQRRAAYAQALEPCPATARARPFRE